MEPRAAVWTGTAVLLSIVGMGLREAGLPVWPAVPAWPIGLLGVWLAAVAAIRLMAAQDRRRAAQPILAGLLAETRSLARQSLAQIGPADTDIAQGMAWRCIAFAHALRDHLRAEPMGEAAMTALAPDEGRAVAGRSNPPNLILASMSREIATAYGRARISAQALQTLEDRVVALGGMLSAAERLRTSPADGPAGVLLHRLAIVFGLLRPFGLASDAGLWTPLLVAVLAFLGFGLEALADMNPAGFGTGAEAPSLDAVARSVEISIRDMLGEPHLPPDRDVPAPGSG